MTEHRTPEFTVFCGPMFSAKTSSLLSYIDKCKYQRKKVVAFKATLDDRYSESRITTHTGSSIPAHSVSSGDDIIRILAELDETYDVIAVDELFMIKGIAETLIWAFRSGISVVVSTLDLSSSCGTFSEVKKILPWATNVVKCTAACSICGADARYSYRKSEADGAGEIFVGGDEIYEARCWKHHPCVGERVEDPK